MIPFDTFTLAAVAAEFAGAVRGAKVQKVQQPSAAEIVLSLYGVTGRAACCSADPQDFRVHLTEVRRETPGAAAVLPAMPSTWKARGSTRSPCCASTACCASSSTPTTASESPSSPNSAAATPTWSWSRARGSCAGRSAHTRRGAPCAPAAPTPDPPAITTAATRSPWTCAPPARPVRCGLAGLIPDAPAVRTWLMTTFSGIGGFAAEEVLASAPAAGGAPAARAALMDRVREGQFDPHSVADEDGRTEGVWAFAPASVPAGRRFRRDGVSVALDTFYATRAQRGADESERAGLARAIARETAFRRKELASARATLAEAGRVEKYERAGNLLLAHLGSVPRGADAVTLPDLYSPDGEETTIALDAKLSPQENAQSYFERARKARDAADYAAGRAEDRGEELAALAALAADLERADAASYPAIRESLAALVGEKRAGGGAERTDNRPAKRTQDRPFGGHRVRTHTVDGYELLVGETAEANDHLTTRVGAPADLWLHVRAGTGAHGILRTAGKPGAVPEAVLRRAAEIVAARSGSSVKHAGLVAVDVVERRHVRKPRGAKPGLVTYTRERTVDVTPRL